MLERLGLSQVADAVYRALLADPGLGVGDLARKWGMSEATVRRGLDELVHSSLVRESMDRPGWLRPVSPEIGFYRLLRRQEADLLRRQHELADRRAALATAVADYASLRQDALDTLDGPMSRQLIGMDAIQTHLEELVHELRDECLSVMPSGAQSAECLAASRPLDQDAMHRGVSLLTLYQDSVRNDPATYAYARWMMSENGQVRTSPLLPPRMLIFDRRVAIIPLDPACTRLGALSTCEAAIVAALVAIFESAWETAAPLDEPRSAVDPECGLSELDRELLRLLANGLTDEAAGNRLGISARTVRRQMAALMDRLGASSRFEAGLKAAQRSWL